MILAALLLVFLFFFPIWRITLIAPQYPGGITMYIWINKITGDTPGNIAEHQYPQPLCWDEIHRAGFHPRTEIFSIHHCRYGLAGLVLAWLNRRRSDPGLGHRFIFLGAAGIYDFYLWEYDYGHNLSPTAPIKVPGMAYQPPLFGRKKLLNFVAYSYPNWGSLFFGLSILFGFAAFWFTKKKIK